MIIRRRFRPLGRVLQRFGRVRINNYTGVTNLASRVEVPPVWEDSVHEPLIWPDADATTAPPASEPEYEPETTPPVGGHRTPRDLALILELHEQQLEQEGYEPTPSPFASAGLSVSGPPLSMGAEPAIQRQPEPEPAPPRRPRPVSPPPETSRRRGSAIVEITPPQSDSVETGPPQPEPDAPAEWETELESEADRPDLYEALVAEGIVQRRPNPDLDSAEFYTPQF